MSQSTTTNDVDPAVTAYFSVIIDGVDLGEFMSCEGLGVEVTIEQREEGGNPFFVHQLPGRLKYTNIKLTRPLTEATSKTAGYIAHVARLPMRRTAEIAARRGDGSVVCRWSLADVLPVRWQGPSLNAESPKVATEVLELAHHGFLDAGAGI